MASKYESPATQDIDVSQQIHLIRRHRLPLDTDPAALHGVPTYRSNDAVKRNVARVPANLACRLTAEERESSRTQIAILETGRGQFFRGF